MSQSPPTKRAKLDLPLLADAPVAEAAPAAASTSSVVVHSLEAALASEPAESLFGTLLPTLGKLAATEPQVGITQYVGPDVPPFSGIIKHRFTDFLVYEIGLDGEPVRLKSLDGPKSAQKAQPQEPQPAEPVKQEPAEMWNEATEAVLTPLVGPAKVDAFKQFIVAGPPARPPKGEPFVKPTFVTDAIESKESRTALHKALREAFPGKLQSEAKEVEGGAQAISIEWSTGGGGGGRNRGERISKAEMRARDGNLPPYIHFTLHKTNKEMHDALAGLCRTLNLQSRDLGTAGTKDKRAVTVQRVSMKRANKTLEDVWRAARGGGGGGRGRGRGRGGYGGGGGPDRGVRIGDLRYGEVMLDLGMSKGNKFVVTLRDVQSADPSTIPRAISTLKNGGFVNYYGMQRFGTAPIPTHAIGLALLRGEWALAAHLILRRREGEGEDVDHARQVWLEGKLDEALRLMPRRCVAERSLLESYKRNGATDHLTAMARIPKNLRMMYVHAYQSYVWNKAVSARIELFGAHKVVEGDLVFEGGADPAGEEEVEAANEPEAVRGGTFSLEPNLDDDEEVNLSAPVKPAPELSAAASAIVSSKVAKVHVVTADDLAQSRFTVFDVVLPLPGFAIVYPTGAVGECYKAVMLADKMNPDDMYRKQKEYSLGGAYRKILHLPKHVEAKQLLYGSSSADLAQSDEDALMGKPKPAVEDYDGFSAVSEGKSVALQIELTLGSSTYATMAMREVLKSRTSQVEQTERTKAMEEKERTFAAKRDALEAAKAVAVAEMDDAGMVEGERGEETVTAEEVKEAEIAA